MTREEMYKQREVELKPLIMCLQSAIELYGHDQAKELGRATMEKYAYNRFVKEFEDIPMDQRWGIFREEVISHADDLVYTIDKHDDNSIRIKYHWCSFHEVFKAYGLEDFVSLYCDTDFTTCRKIHPDITMTRTKILPDGADFCDHSWTYKPKEQT